MTYRPTVRYSDVFKEYVVNSLIRATTLDRNQIIRAALFSAAHTSEFQQLLEQYKKKKDVPLLRGTSNNTYYGWNNVQR